MFNLYLFYQFYVTMLYKITITMFIYGIIINYTWVIIINDLVYNYDKDDERETLVEITISPMLFSDDIWRFLFWKIKYYIINFYSINLGRIVCFINVKY